MTTRYVLDSSAVLRYLDGGAGNDRVRDVLKHAFEGRCELLISAVSWGEIFYVIARDHGIAAAKHATSALRVQLPVIPLTDTRAEAAAHLKHQFKLAYADACAGALAMQENAVLVTADFDFKAVSHVIKTEFLPKA